MRFAGFEGNQSAKRILSSFVDRGRIPHAVLIEGPAGSGRRTLAKILAQAAVCISSGEKPCGVCGHCRKMSSGNHPDVLMIGGEGPSSSFPVETVREIRSSAYILPNEAEYKVLILSGASGTSTGRRIPAENREEPPPHLLFILTCEPFLLPTIRSAWSRLRSAR